VLAVTKALALVIPGSYTPIMARDQTIRPFSQLGPIAIRYGLEHPCASYKEIEDAVGLTPNTLRVAVYRLKKAGKLPPEWALRPGTDNTPKPWPKKAEGETQEPEVEEPPPVVEVPPQQVWKRHTPLTLAASTPKGKPIVVAPTITEKASAIIDRLADYLLTEKVDSKAYPNVVISFRGMVQDFGSVQQYQKVSSNKEGEARTSLRDRLLGDVKVRQL